MRLSHKALEAKWDTQSAKWTVRLENVKTKQIFEDSADVIISAIGVLNEWRMPKLTGLDDFKGKLIHSAAWDEHFRHEVCTLTLVEWETAELRLG